MKDICIVITGFMGAGKTTVAAALALALGCRCVDLDELIAAHEGRTPTQLIDSEGEAYFRVAESRALGAALVDDNARVIALGGGTWAFEGNRALVAECDCFTVWLDAPFELCWQRITGGAQVDRPFARDRERARKLYDERQAGYRLAGWHIHVAP